MGMEDNNKDPVAEERGYITIDENTMILHPNRIQFPNVNLNEYTPQLKESFVFENEDTEYIFNLLLVTCYQFLSSKTFTDKFGKDNYERRAWESKNENQNKIDGIWGNNRLRGNFMSSIISFLEDFLDCLSEKDKSINFKGGGFNSFLIEIRSECQKLKEELKNKYHSYEDSDKLKFVERFSVFVNKIFSFFVKL